MLTLRLSSMGSDRGYYSQEIRIDSNLHELIENVIMPLKLQRPTEEVFQVLVNGYRIDPSFWRYTNVGPHDDVLIAPILSSGENAQLFKSFVIIAVTVAVGVATGGWGALAQGLVTAGATLGASVIMNSLIPPPVPESMAVGSAGFNYADSQAYAISGQSNRVSKFGSVPKLYGFHRVFPLIAANPYVQLEVEPTGELVQYFYCIYDFGLGEVRVTNLKIGDTPISSFASSYNFVDFNKPSVAESAADNFTVNELTWYKGDVETDSVAVNLNGDWDKGEAESTYLAYRNSAPNTDSVSQEIILDFVNPQGLFAFAATGERGPRSILVDVYFADVNNPSVQFAFNDLNYVKNFSAIGGDQEYQNTPLVLPPADRTTFTQVTTGVKKRFKKRVIFSAGLPTGKYWETWTQEFSYGKLAGTNDLIFQTNASLVAGSVIILDGVVIGKLSGVSIASGISGFTRYFFETPFTRNIEIYRFTKVTDININGVVTPGETISWENKYVVATNRAFKQVINLGRFKITREQSGPTYSSCRFTPRNAGQYRVMVRRVGTTSVFTTQIQDDLTWYGISTRFDRAPIKTSKRHTFLELRIKATNQINGTIQNLSGEAMSSLEVYEGGVWVKRETNNPAWIFADLMTGEVNKRAISKDRLHLPSLIEWADFCDEIPDSPNDNLFVDPRFTCNFFLDYQATLQEVINQVTNAAQASLNIIDGKYGVLIDKRKTVPVQVFTPRNSWGFSSSRNYARTPHAVKIKYIDPGADWSLAEKIIYDTGYDINNATEIDDIQSFGCIESDQAWRLGRNLLAQSKLRKETIVIQVDFEHLVCTRGDYVRVTHDVMKAGGTPARVKTISSNRVTLDDSIETIIASYGYLFRATDGQIYTNTLTVVNSNTFDLDGSPLPQVGDLIVIGVIGSVYIDCLVRSITPNEDLSATLVLIEKADAIYDAESTGDIPDYSPNISVTADTEFSAPGEVRNLVVIANTWEVIGAQYQYYITLDWDVPIGSAYELFEVYADSGSGYSLVDTTQKTDYKYIVDPNNLGIEHSFKVLAVSTSGKKLGLGEVGSVSATPLSKTARPSNVSSLAIDITGEVLQLFWTQVQDIDVKEYLIRYSPSVAGTWEVSIPLLRADKSLTLAATQARTGTYLIKAIDLNNNESEVAATAITTIPNLFGLNLIEEITDFPDLLGNTERVMTTGSVLMLQESFHGDILSTEYYSDGYYYYVDLLDLGEIYTVRLQSLIQSEGFTLQDMMSEWVTLDTVLAMSNSRYSEWDVQTEYRTTDSFNVMSDWATMSSVTQMSFGEDDDWTAWKPFTIGDATGRIFQFRLKLLSNKLSVTPRVYDGTIRADMPDRIERFNNISAPDTGYVLTYNPAFKGPGTSPNIQITIDNAQSGDYWVISSKSLTGFTINFYDKNDTQVARVFDAAVLGFGSKATAIL